MSKLKIYDMSGKVQGDVEVPDADLVLDRGERAVHEAVIAYNAAQRSGTASTLTKGQVAGHNKKPWKQKGTGQARAGYRQSPIWRGGGVAFGPHPRSYRKGMNKKTRQLAFTRAFSDKVSEGAIKVVDKIELAAAKTKDMVAMLKALEVGSSTLIVTAQVDTNICLSARNIPKVSVATADAVNVYELLRFDTLIATPEAIEQLRSRMQKNEVKV